MNLLSQSCFGYCERCRRKHFLSESPRSRELALKLIKTLERKERVDFDDPGPPNSNYSINYLFGKARGQMFGVLVCENEQGREVVLKAFSCQYNSHWLIDGWVTPLLDLDVYHKIVPEADVKIKALTKEMESLEKGSAGYLQLLKQRKDISRELMREIHGLYSFHNFCGDVSSIYEVFEKGKGIPTGAGDCCAPKLLNYAAKHGLKPLGLSEFFFGQENKSGSRQHKHFYPCCEEKCQPLLGYMLCGVEEL